jgi:phosphoribosyl-AMP cyclohydrolase
MCMMYNPTEFHVSGDSDALVITIKQKLIGNCHKMATFFFFFFAFHKNSALKELQIF